MKSESTIDLFGKTIIQEDNSILIEKHLLKIFKGKVLSQKEINDLPESIKQIK